LPGGCGSGKGCDGSGACVALAGSGTAAAPYNVTPPFSKCSVYFSTFPAAPDGIYTINPGSGAINVYCDMVHGGITYANFGFGVYTGAYAGWTQVGSADFSGTAEFPAAFAYLYDRNGGLVNLQPGFVSSNCCIIDTTENSYFGIDGDVYMYPYMGTAFSCNPATGYTQNPMQLAGGSPNTNEIPPSITAAQAGTVATSTACSIGANPAIFVQKY
jgi:hypothetical protein